MENLTGPLPEAVWQRYCTTAPVAGRFATRLFAVGLLGASALAAAVVPLSTTYAISVTTIEPLLLTAL